jgi:hypothetical protein
VLFRSGLFFPLNTGEAVRLYRRCAYRGSEGAYAALKRIHDAVRPKDKEFDIESKD